MKRLRSSIFIFATGLALGVTYLMGGASIRAGSSGAYAGSDSSAVSDNKIYQVKIFAEVFENTSDKNAVELEKNFNDWMRRNHDLIEVERIEFNGGQLSLSRISVLYKIKEENISKLH